VHAEDEHVTGTELGGGPGAAELLDISTGSVLKLPWIRSRSTSDCP